jgi:hypothetical protein
MGYVRAIGVLICIALATGGCGSDPAERSEDPEDEARAVVRKFLAAVASDDATAACRQFEPRSARIWFRGPCDPRPSFPIDFEEAFADGELRSVRLVGGEGEAVIQSPTYGESGLALRDTADGWRIFNLTDGSRAARQDVRAIRQVRTTTFAYGEHLGPDGDSFAGVDVRDLREYSRGVPLDAKVTSRRRSFTISIASRSGNVFRVRGTLVGKTINLDRYECRSPGVGKCPADGVWEG